MIHRGLNDADLAAARATLAVLRSAPEVEQAVAGAPSDAVLRRRRMGFAGTIGLGVIGTAFGVFAIFHVDEFAPEALFAGVVGVMAIRSGVAGLVRSNKAARAGARLVLVIARSVERGKSNEMERRSVTVETADGRRDVLHDVDPEAWARMRPGHAGILWSHGRTLGDFRDLGPAVPGATDEAPLDAPPPVPQDSRSNP